MKVGVMRHLIQCSDADGKLTILAIDHRDNLIAEMQKRRSHPVTFQDVAAFKSDVMRSLSQSASAVLTDPDYGMPGVLNGAVPGSVGLIAPLEITDYSLHFSQRQPRLIPGWDVHKLKRAGFSGAKLLIYYNPEAPDAQAKTDLVDRIVAECQDQQIPLFLEPLVYSPDPDRALTNEERAQLIVETARHFSQRGVTILKLEFPFDAAESDMATWQGALAQIKQACAVPWTLLSAGVSFDLFLQQTEAACQFGGASGVMVGRALWAEAVALDGDARRAFLQTTGVARMRQLAERCNQLAATIHPKNPVQISEGWYR